MSYAANECLYVSLFHVITVAALWSCSSHEVLLVCTTRLQKVFQRMKRRDFSRFRSFTCDVLWTDNTCFPRWWWLHSIAIAFLKACRVNSWQHDIVWSNRNSLCQALSAVTITYCILQTQISENTWSRIIFWSVYIYSNLKNIFLELFKLLLICSPHWDHINELFSFYSFSYDLQNKWDIWFRYWHQKSKNLIAGKLTLLQQKGNCR